MKGEVQFRADRLAVLIDADNARASLIEPLLKEIAKYGTKECQTNLWRLDKPPAW